MWDDFICLYTLELHLALCFRNGVQKFIHFPQENIEAMIFQCCPDMKDDTYFQSASYSQPCKYIEHFKK